jgi:integrase
LSLISTLRKFGERPADKIKPAEIDAWLSKVTKTPATSNRYRALFSLIFREALRNGKIASNAGDGMRLSEQYTLAWKNIDFERREINPDRTKNCSPRMIPMNDAVMGAMAEFARRSKSTSRDALVFRSRTRRTGSSRRWKMPGS